MYFRSLSKEQEKANNQLNVWNTTLEEVGIEKGLQLAILDVFHVRGVDKNVGHLNTLELLRWHKAEWTFGVVSWVDLSLGSTMVSFG